MCFSLDWIRDILIWLVIVCAVIAILKLLIPSILSQLGWAGNLVLNILNIAVWAFVIIVIIAFAFDIIGCLLSSGIHLPGWHH